MKKIFLVLITIVLFLASSGQIHASSEYFVDNVNGADSNNGTSSSSAWQTLNKVNSFNFQAGDVIRFKKGGTWSGRLTIDDSGTQSNPITFSSFGSGAKPIIANPSGDNCIRIYSDWIIIEGMKITGARREGIIINSGADRNVVRDIEAEDIGMGVYIYGQYNQVTNSYFHNLKMVNNTQGGDDDYGAVGVVINNANNEVAYSRFVDCQASSFDYGEDGGAVELYDTADNAYVHHNWAQDNIGFMEVGSGDNSTANNVILAYNVSYNNGGFTGLHTSGNFASRINNFRAENNTIIELKEESSSSLLGFYDTSSPSTYIFRNNLVVLNNFQSVSSSESFTHENNIYYLMKTSTAIGFSLSSSEKKVNPLLVNLNGADFHLQAGSPAINTGINSGYTTDFDGITVPVGATPDIGAFEYSNNICQGDLNSDNVVNLADLAKIISKWGQSNISTGEDMDGNGTVNLADLNLLLSNWGKNCQ